MRKAAVIVGALLLILVGLDRLAVLVAEDQVANRVRSSQQLGQEPDVDIKGFPFLTQVVRGRYGEVTASVQGLQREGLTIARLSVEARGVHVALGDLLDGQVESIPVDRATGDVLLAYDDLNAYIATQVPGPDVTVTNDGGRVRVSGTFELPLVGSRTVSGEADVGVDTSAGGNAVTIRPTALDPVAQALPEPVEQAAIDLLTVEIQVEGLPFGVELTSAHVTDEGVRFDATAEGLTIRTSQVGGP